MPTDNPNRYFTGIYSSYISNTTTINWFAIPTAELNDIWIENSTEQQSQRNPMCKEVDVTAFEKLVLKNLDNCKFHGNYMSLGETFYVLEHREFWNRIPRPGALSKIKDKLESNPELTKFYFGDGNPNGLLYLHSYKEFLRYGDFTNLETGFMYVTGDLPRIVNRMCTAGSQEEFLDTWRDFNALLKKSVKLADHIDNFQTGVPHNIRNSELYSALRYAINCQITGSALHVVPPTRFLPTNLKAVNPWTRELEELTTSSIPENFMTIEEYEKRINNKEIKLRRFKAKLRETSEILPYRGVNMATFYPPLPIDEDERPLRAFKRGGKEGVFLHMGIELELNYAQALDKLKVDPQNYTPDRDTLNEMRRLCQSDPRVRLALREITKELQIQPMHDGSVSGPELVSSPGTLAPLRRMWCRALELLREANCFWAGSNTGLHVHVSRRVLTPLMAGKLAAFINSDTNHEFIKYIAGRNFHEVYAKKIKGKLSTRIIGTDKYTSVNFRPNDTIEFRIFEATLDDELFCARLEFVDALIHWVHEDMPGTNQLNVESFTKFVFLSRTEYPNLAAIVRNYFAG